MNMIYEGLFLRLLRQGGMGQRRSVVDCNGVFW